MRTASSRAAEEPLLVSRARSASHEIRVSEPHCSAAYGSFRRSIRLPTGIGPNKVDVRFDRAVVKITVPKPEEAKQNRPGSRSRRGHRPVRERRLRAARSSCLLSPSST